MTEPLVIRIPFDAGRCAPNALRRMCWQARKRVADEAKEAATVAWRLGGSPVWNVPVRVCVTIRRGRRLDPDNALGSLKACVDALFVGRITPDDSSAWISFGPVLQVTGAHWRRQPEVEFTVRPRVSATAAALGDPAAAMEIEMETETTTEAGWAKPKGARSAHYWPQGNQRPSNRSACGKWRYTGTLCAEEDLETRMPLCKTCTLAAAKTLAWEIVQR